MLPCTSAGTLRELVTRLGSHLRRTIKVVQLPRWMIKTAAVVVPLMRELDEMLYQWDEPFVLDDSRFRDRFQAVPADVSHAAVETVEWANWHYRTPSKIR